MLTDYAPLRSALQLSKRDNIHYSIRPSSEVVITRAETSDGDDPALGRFLGFLARDIAEHPARLQAIDASFVQHLQSLAGDIEVDLDAPTRPRAAGVPPGRLLGRR